MRKPHGSGPGAITPDGCAVELYARLPAGREPEIIHAAAGDGASILELGCGVGRVTHPLIALGHEVTAVDESPEMLERVRCAQTVLSPIEDLDLGGLRFDAVVLPSHLINEPSGNRVAAWLATCRRHVTSDGCVIIESYRSDWYDTVTEGESERDGIIFRMRDVSRPSPGLVRGTVEYQAGDLVWRQTFGARRLDDALLGELLGGAGLALDRYLTEDQAWIRAVPAA
ncbi:MAG: class I SAM-dependent methyltransferase [Nocardiopsaceae bacterium]|nr:class I SAM-dependent methyltransferase [Nocardiopsaceae bacterium]